MANFPKAMMVAENYATLYIPFEVSSTKYIEYSIGFYFFEY